MAGMAGMAGMVAAAIGSTGISVTGAVAGSVAATGCTGSGGKEVCIGDGMVGIIIGAGVTAAPGCCHTGGAIFGDKAPGGDMAGTAGRGVD